MKRQVFSFFAAVALTCSSDAAISILDSTILASGSTSFSATVNATSATKLVAIISGENGFSSAADSTITSVAITGGGGSFTQLVHRAPVTTGDINVNDIWYFDLTGIGSVTVDVTMSSGSRGIISLFALMGTANGAGATAISGSGSQSVNLTTTAANSMVLVGIGTGGNGNTASHTTSLTGVGSLTKVNATTSSNATWNGLATGQQTVATVGTNSFAFSGGNGTTDTAGSNVVAAEFLAAVPEPSSFALLTIGAIGFLLRRRRV